MDERKFANAAELARLDLDEEAMMRKTYKLLPNKGTIPEDRAKRHELFVTASGKFSHAWRRLYGQDVK